MMRCPSIISAYKCVEYHLDQVPVVSQDEWHQDLTFEDDQGDKGLVAFWINKLRHVIDRAGQGRYRRQTSPKPLGIL